MEKATSKKLDLVQRGVLLSATACSLAIAAMVVFPEHQNIPRVVFGLCCFGISALTVLFMQEIRSKVERMDSRMAQFRQELVVQNIIQTVRTNPVVRQVVRTEIRSMMKESTGNGEKAVP